jgi:hypothetical protein
MIPINFRERPKHARDFELCNQFSLFALDLDLVSDFQNALKIVLKGLRQMKNPFDTMGLYYLLILLLSLPTSLTQLAFDFFGSKPTFGASNV